VLLHLLWPESWPLFNQAIIESFGPLLFGPFNYGQQFAQQLSVDLNCSLSDPDQQLQCLKAIPAETIYNTANSRNLLGSFGPVVDGYSIIQQPLTSILNGLTRPKTSVRIGNNLKEGELFALSDALSLSMNQNLYQKLIHSFDLVIQFADLFEPWYQGLADSQGYWEAYSSFFEDYIFLCGTQYFADYATTSGTTVYRYRFQHKTVDAPFPFSLLNATHFTEVPYVFQMPYGVNFGFSFNDEELALSNSIVQYWANFVSGGNPNGPNTEVVWPTYSPLTSGNHTIVLDLSISTTSENLHDETCDLWKAIFFVVVS